VRHQFEYPLCFFSLNPSAFCIYINVIIHYLTHMQQGIKRAYMAKCTELNNFADKTIVISCNIGMKVSASNSTF